MIDISKADIFLFLFAATAISAKGADNITNAAVKNMTDTGSTANFSLREEKLKNDGLVMINNHSIPINANILKNMLIMFSRQR